MGFLKLVFWKMRKNVGGHSKTSKKFQKNFFNEIFEHCHSAENVKGLPLGFFSIHSVAKYRNKRVSEVRVF